MAVAVGSAEVTRRDKGLNQQPVDSIVWRVLQRECGEIDLLVPELEQPVVGAKSLSGLAIQDNVRLSGPLRQPIAELPWRHG